ncbi:peptidoglycan-binding protein [Streptomyces sp. NPDC102278]|uniref:peptidoglycan-binding domain-containing protein n=1 Tax=Streptomyces sp. NPDC102278 TaxID=3366152 RepID=UPI0038138B66
MPLDAKPPAPLTATAPPASATTTPTTGEGQTLRQGDSGAEVRKLQRLLAARGAYDGEINGQFDKHLKTVVSKFQRDHGLRVENLGTYGPKTRKALEG